MNLRYKLTMKEIKSIIKFNTLSRDITYNIFVYKNNLKIFFSMALNNQHFNFTFSETTIIDKMLSKKISYSKIRDIQIFDNIIFLITDTSYIITIPKRVFATKEYLIKFSDLINKNVEKQSIDSAFSRHFNSKSTIEVDLSTSLFYKENTNIPFKELSLDNKYFRYNSDLENLKLSVSSILSSNQKLHYTSYNFKIDNSKIKTISINKLNYPILAIKNFDTIFKIHVDNNNLNSNSINDL